MAWPGKTPRAAMDSQVTKPRAIKPSSDPAGRPFFIGDRVWSVLQGNGLMAHGPPWQVTVWGGTAGVVADIDVWGMGCGWLTPSYTENPTL